MGELTDYLEHHDANFRKARLSALYSDFRSQRTLNIEGYNANITAWRNALSRLATEGLLARHNSDSSVLVLSVDTSLLRALEHKKYGQPLTLGAVVHDAVSHKELIPLAEFNKLQHSIYQSSWASVPWNVMGWALRQAGLDFSLKGQDTLPKGRYVIVENMEAASTKLRLLMADKTSKFDQVFTKTEFQKTFATELINHQRLSDSDFDVLLKYLSRDKDIIAYDGQTIKIKTSNNQGSLSEEDSAMASIKELTANLKHQTALLDARIAELEAEAKAAVARKNRISALAALKSKKIAESSLATRYTTLSQLEEVAARIEQASDNVQLVKIMESSTGVLEKLNSEVGSVEKVDGVMDRLREQMSDTDEVSAILAESTGVAIDEGEIDEELAAMESQEHAQEEEARRQKLEAEKQREQVEAQRVLDALPDVPMGTEPMRALTPTTETGIGDLVIGDGTEKERQPIPDA
ncbi:Snf7-domain-containing protein [Stachybotrys elegans]|uniref:Snf7-domain-containing protein n=1 Tax=Stachybotrys elegans TaxID=80388 RepID=A0A8K0WW66_9HYPO|nr:Snf7-domain-containing protein [Stachybotrys elegans]